MKPNWLLKLAGETEDYVEPANEIIDVNMRGKDGQIIQPRKATMKKIAAEAGDVVQHIKSGQRGKVTRRDPNGDLYVALPGGNSAVWSPDEVNIVSFGKVRNSRITQIGVTLQRGDGYLIKYLDKSEITDDEKAVSILKSKLSEEEKEQNLIQRVKEILNERPDSEAEVKQVDWSGVEVDRRDIYQLMREYEDMELESDENYPPFTASRRTSSEKPITSSDQSVNIPDGEYKGGYCGHVVTLASGEKFHVEPGIRQNFPTPVVVKIEAGRALVYESPENRREQERLRQLYATGLPNEKLVGVFQTEYGNAAVADWSRMLAYDLDMGQKIPIDQVTSKFIRDADEVDLFKLDDIEDDVDNSSDFDMGIFGRIKVAAENKEEELGPEGAEFFTTTDLTSLDSDPSSVFASQRTADTEHEMLHTVEEHLRGDREDEEKEIRTLQQLQEGDRKEMREDEELAETLKRQVGSQHVCTKCAEEFTVTASAKCPNWFRKLGADENQNLRTFYVIEEIPDRGGPPMRQKKKIRATSFQEAIQKFWASSPLPDEWDPETDNYAVKTDTYYAFWNSNDPGMGAISAGLTAAHALAGLRAIDEGGSDEEDFDEIE